MEVPAPDLSGLPADILISIFQLLECPDLLRSAAVCTFWQKAYSTVRRSGVCPSRQTPCLLYCNEAAGVRALGMYSLSERNAYSLPLPEPPISNWIGSSHGWLVTMDEKSDLMLLNPITGDKIALPPVTTMEHVKPVVNDDGVLEKYKMSFYDGELPRVEDTPYACPLDRYGDLVYLKATLSSDPSAGECTVMLIHQPYAQLSFAKVGDAHWNWLQMHSFYADCIHHDGCFYAMTEAGAIDVFDLNGPSVVHRRILPNLVRMVQKCYIVQAPWGDVLQIIKDESLDPEQPDGETYVTAYEVYKVDFVELKRVKMRGIGEYALFTGKSTTSCFSVKDHPGLMANHLYFTHDDHDELLSGKDDPRDIGVYDLENDTRTNLVDPEPWRTWFPPIWFTPNLAKADAICTCTQGVSTSASTSEVTASS
ncbi:hypothetical protein CFC21_110712 [Triticum aestivum]|uniref:F-box domain-containing protein n=3 Tax=Triticinae TaxID=1648030 RepID=A0A3B6TWK2_WHEAT|nr:F-box protein At2g14500-like [Aegilops tauschii subsp. strangulata]XP_044440382.1 F-box protein At2g14500-like [Triticum aestivum]KAF7110628.1 hypothetical protein CFC21_110712 [Triticum aestivum]